MAHPALASLQRTPLHAAHARLGARMTGFASWSMPLQYAGIIAEHRAVRSAAGLFDVSHMGELECTGAGAAACVARLTCLAVERLAVGQARYSLILNDAGGIIDDVIVYRLGAAWYRIVVNAANAAAVAEHARAVAAAAGAELRDAGAELGLLALQGPRAAAIVQAAGGAAAAALGRYRCGQAAVADIPVLAARTGYTGEDGFELFVAAKQAEALWWRLLEAGAGAGLTPAGLGARDTLRLEAALPLYGNELRPDVSPLEVGLGRFAARGGSYIGATALRRQREAGVARALVHLQLHGRAVARAGNPITTAAGAPIGRVTSGGYGPWLRRPLAMGLVARQHAAVGGELAVLIRGRAHGAAVVPRPFYRRERREEE